MILIVVCVVYLLFLNLFIVCLFFVFFNVTVNQNKFLNWNFKGNPHSSLNKRVA